MENYVGKICPYCKTAITEADAVTVCPACGIPHHASCWVENRGCTTFGCSQQYYEAQGTNPTSVCTNCGAPLGDDQAFCPKCGTPKVSAPKEFCTNCGAELQPGQDFCVQCGQRKNVGPTTDAATVSAINAFNANVTQAKKKSKTLPIILGVVGVVVVIIGILLAGVIKEKRAEEAKEQYIKDMEEFIEFSLDATVNLEDIADTVVDYWYDCIWYDMYGSDINRAIAAALDDCEYELDLAVDNDTKMKKLYDKVKKVPSGLDEDDEEELQEMCDLAKEVYAAYEDYYDFATDPSGSYNSFTADKGTYTDNFLAPYEELYDLVN